jgi:SAM-dependent methyltransferase
MLGEIVHPVASATGRWIPVRHRKVAWGHDDIRSAILTHLQKTPRWNRCIDVLDAGGGAASNAPLPKDARITVIDISVEQLERNTDAAEKLLGDLETFDFGDRQFDLVVMWDVLEHLGRPEMAIARLVGCLREGGIIIIVGPLPNTAKSLVTKYTPHAFHVFVYRHFLHAKHAGQPGYAPFQVHLARGSRVEEIIGVLERLHTQPKAVEYWESPHVSSIGQKSPILLLLYRFGEMVLNFASFGRIEPGVTDFLLIGEKIKSVGGQEGETKLARALPD